MADVDTFDSIDIGDIDTINSIDLTDIDTLNTFDVPSGISGSLWVWGLNAYGQLGIGDITSRSSPTQVGSETTWSYVSYGEQHCAAVREGKLFTWGDGNSGRTGHGNVTDYSSPVQVGTLTDWKIAECMDGATICIKTDGTLWGFGQNDVGQLGQLDIINYSSPVQIGTATNWVTVSCSQDSFAAINSLGEMWTCGSGFYGVLGIGSTAHRSSPVQVGALTDWAKTKSGYMTVQAIKTDGTFWTWGRNDYYQLGFPTTTTHRSSPVQIGTGTDWLSAVQAWNNEGTTPSRHGNGIKGGSLQGWGLNYSDGRMGDLFTYSSGVTYSSPVQLGASGTWTAIDNGTEHGIAIKSDGSLYTWGESASGQTGGGNTSDRSSPMQVGSETDWVFIAAADHMSAGIRS